MAARLLVIATSGKNKPRKACLLVCAMIFAFYANVSSDPAAASDRQEIRFYKINKDGITQRLRFTRKKARQLGCHNFLRRARLHRTVQFAFKTCHVYAAKNCRQESIVSFYREKEPEPTTELGQGYGWYPVGEHKRGELVKSWDCE